MKQNLPLIFRLLFCFTIGALPLCLHAQAGIFNPNDPVVNYDASKPPVKPAFGKVGKWVRTPMVSWSTTAYKCYIYNGIPFRLKFPKNYDSTKKYPIIIFFHGDGEYGRSAYDNEYQLALGGQAHQSAVDNGKFDGFLLYPQNLNPSWYAGPMGTVNDLIEKVMIPMNMVDPFRVYIDGLSAGGQAVWQFMMKYYKLVAAATPISAAASQYYDSISKYKFIPIYHFQGGQDPAPTPATSRSLGNKILAAGGNYRYKEFPSLGHSCWNESWADTGYFPFYARAHKANAWALHGKTDFCEGETVLDTIGVTPGFDGYEWRKDGALISGANTNQIVVTELGTYDCRVKRGTLWSVWSPIPVVLKRKYPTVQPAITITDMHSRLIPAPDSSTSVPLEVPAGYNTYTWQKVGSTTTLSTTRYLVATTPGDYQVKVTEVGGCPWTGGSQQPSSSTSIKVEAENFVAMYGVKVETTGDVGGGSDVGYIDPNDYMDYSLNIPTAGKYTMLLRIASPNTGGQFVIKSGSTVLATVNVPNTGGWQKFVDVTTTITLSAGAQTLRVQSVTTPEWNFNYFVLTGQGQTTTGEFSAPFTVLNANGANAPSPVTALTATTLSKTSIQLKWSQNASPAYNETGFEIYRNDGPGTPTQLVAITAADATGITLNSLNAGVAYSFKVRAINNSAASSVATATATTQADVTAPTTPGSLRVGSITKSYVELIWTASTDDVGVSRYDVYINGNRTYAAQSARFIAYNLLPGTNYSFAVKARDVAGNTSAFSNTVTATTTTGTAKLDSTQVPLNKGNFSVYLHFSLDVAAPSPWNNTNIFPSEGTAFKNLYNYQGNLSGVNVTIENNFSGYNPDGMNTGNNSGVYPDKVLMSSYYCDKGIKARLRVDGLPVNYTYSFIFFGSRNGSGNRTGVYAIGNQKVKLNASLNTKNTVQIDNVTTDTNGQVFIDISLDSLAQFAYLNALVIKAYCPPYVSSSNTAQAADAVTANSLMVATDATTAASVYPNPFVNNVTVSLPLTKAAPVLTLRLTDASGRQVMSRQYKDVPAGLWQQSLLLSDQAIQPGLYVLYISGLPDNQIKVVKLLKKK